MTTPLQSASRDMTDLVNKPVAYSLFLRVLHWTTALLMFVAIPVAWYMTSAELSHPIRENWFTFHKSIGLTLLLLTLTRVVARMSSTIPPLPEQIPKIERLAAHLGHALLYVILFAMPISGYINSAAGGQNFSWFWLFPVPIVVPIAHALSHFAGMVHAALAWLTYALIGGHALAVVYHQLIERVDILSRMTGRETRQ